MFDTSRGWIAWIGAIIGLTLLLGLSLSNAGADGKTADMLIDDFSNDELISKLDTRWRGVSDQVMGGVSEASVTRGTDGDRVFLRLSGDVRLDNNGGFIQAAIDLAPSGASFDASGFKGIRLVVRGNGEKYSVHLRTPDNTRPWQSYRAHFIAVPEWTTIDLAFSTFEPYRVVAPLDTGKLRRLGLVAIGRAFNADLSVSEISFYR